MEYIYLATGISILGEAKNYFYIIISGLIAPIIATEYRVQCCLGCVLIWYGYEIS